MSVLLSYSVLLTIIIHFYWTLDLASNYLSVVQVPPSVFCTAICPHATMLFTSIAFQ